MFWVTLYHSVTREGGREGTCRIGADRIMGGIRWEWKESYRGERKGYMFIAFVAIECEEWYKRKTRQICHNETP